jgi:hypothetical protein
MDGSCKKTIETVNIATKKIDDNTYFLIKFPAQTNSKGQTYCFSVAAAPGTPAAPLAIQLSKPGIYPKGLTTINGQPSERDIVFNVHYK